MGNNQLVAKIDHAYRDFVGRAPGGRFASFELAEFLAEAVGRAVTEPTEWNGEGLPPVGSFCEVRFGKDDISRWEKIEVLYRGIRFIAIRFEDGEVCEFGTLPPLPGEFRPIRTADQIAADERLHKIRNACSAISQATESYNLDINCSAAMRAVVEAMIDEGYSK